jgi:hypothetical protein
MSGCFYPEEAEYENFEEQQVPIDPGMDSG